MPDDLAGLCKLRIGDYRILYWIYHDKKVVRIYRVAHRSDVYRDLCQRLLALTATGGGCGAGG